jgi:drug/metabolite transporter (DMT)-like permease
VAEKATRRASPSRDGRRKLSQIIAGVVVGVVIAFLYHVASVRTTTWLADRGGKAFPVLSVGGFVLRILVLGLVFLALGTWLRPYVNIVAAALSFIVCFTGLAGFSLYRFAVRGRTPGNSTRTPS